MKKGIIALLCVFSTCIAFSQTEISGTVKDNTGVPIPGANVSIVGSNTGTITDFDGNFSFSSDLTGSRTVQISYIGYKTHLEAVELNASPISLQIVLQEGNSLDEVVLTASSTFRSQKQA